jgi:hypothetical protein
LAATTQKKREREREARRSKKKRGIVVMKKNLLENYGITASLLSLAPCGILELEKERIKSRPPCMSYDCRKKSKAFVERINNHKIKFLPLLARSLQLALARSLHVVRSRKLQ